MHLGLVDQPHHKLYGQACPHVIPQVMTWLTRGGVAPCWAHDLRHTHVRTFWFAGCTRNQVAGPLALLAEAE